MIQLGDIVLYNTTDEDKELMKGNGNIANILPAIVVGVWSADCVNLKVIHDGLLPDMWKTSVMRDDVNNVGCWQFKYSSDHVSY